MRRATTDKMQVTVDGNFVNVKVEPNLLNETDALTINSHTALAASRAVFEKHPEAQALMVEVLNELNDQFGERKVERVTMIQINRPTNQRFDYIGMRSRVQSDNKLLFCVADKYQIMPVVYTRIQDKGCLTAPAKL